MRTYSNSASLLISLNLLTSSELSSYSQRPSIAVLTLSQRFPVRHPRFQLNAQPPAPAPLFF